MKYRYTSSFDQSWRGTAKGMGLSFVAWREETQGHIPGKRHYPTTPPRGQNQSGNLLTTLCMSPSWSRPCI